MTLTIEKLIEKLNLKVVECKELRKKYENTSGGPLVISVTLTKEFMLKEILSDINETEFDEREEMFKILKEDKL